MDDNVDRGTGEVGLILRRFPAELISDDLSRDLLANFGGNVKRKGKDVVYATFADKKAAEEALFRLHQLRVLGRRLVVEFASDSESSDMVAGAGAADSSRDVNQTAAAASSSSTAVDASKKKSSVREDVQEFSRDLNAIGRSFGLDYPMSQKLYYSYPRPNAATLANIGGALMVVPRFYHQVLHLMNKMNLPAPFGPQVHFPGLAFVVPDDFTSIEKASGRFIRRKDDEDEKEEQEEEDEAESELGSEPDEASASKRSAEVRDFMSNEKQRRRLHTGGAARSVKRARLQLISDGQRPTRSGDSARPEEVFELPSSQASKRIEFKLDVKFPEANESVATLVDAKKTEMADEKTPPKRKLYSDDELRVNRLSKEEMEALSVFKNYSSGVATRRLYLKNLAKQVDEEDLRSIYRRYVGGELETETFDVRLMREGRMKGQAFVTYESEENARNALDNTNGFVLHGKPFVVQFARCDKSK